MESEASELPRGRVLNEGPDVLVGTLAPHGREGVMCLICPPPSNLRPFGSSMASDSMGTPKLSEFGLEQSQDR
ncbi:hypothetical protein L3X38_026286 [Prunus dulcis]|uniref:Uncharacterized protein n=1 Tax=Prunus dulcis TaxID=3755 RepID=A0AAD4USI0_PRUDU|nr:hypothetical protein L3X38_026286 [Prunus dulcis]